VLLRAVVLGELTEAEAADRRAHLTAAASHWHVANWSRDCRTCAAAVSWRVHSNAGCDSLGVGSPSASDGCRIGTPQSRRADPPSGRPAWDACSARLTRRWRKASRFTIRDRFETVNTQTRRKTGHHPGPEDKASQQDRQLHEICKTSIPGSNPGGASKFFGSIPVAAESWELR
jgi:hypothetical protein